MSNLQFFKDYILYNSEGKNNKEIIKHHIYKLDDLQIKEVNVNLTIPFELKQFWREYGYGFFHKNLEFSIYRLLGPELFQMINLKEDFYEFDPILEMYEVYENKLIFFQVNEGIYLLIDKEDINEKNAIYYFDEKIADSLEEFLIKFDKDPHYFEDNSNE